MTEDVEFRRTRIRPVDCLAQGHRLTAKQYWLFVGVGAMFVLASQVPLGLLLGPIAVGATLCLDDRRRGETVRFQRLFDGFQSFLESLIAAVILMALVTLVSMLAAVPFAGILPLAAHEIDKSDNPLPFIALMFALFVGVFFLLAVLGTFFYFAFPLVALKRMRGLDAIAVSFRAAKANFFGLLGLQLLCAALYLVASACCFFPLFLVLPAILAAGYVAYCKVFEGVEAVA